MGVTNVVEPHPKFLEQFVYSDELSIESAEKLHQFSRKEWESLNDALIKRAISLGALAGCFGIAVHSFVEFNLQVTTNAQLFLALAALATTKAVVQEPSEPVKSQNLAYALR